jgi:hypothetical protein
MIGAGVAIGAPASAGSINAIKTPSTGTMIFSLVVDISHSPIVPSMTTISFSGLRSNAANAGCWAHPPKIYGLCVSSNNLEGSTGTALSSKRNLELEPSLCDDATVSTQRGIEAGQHVVVRAEFPPR